ncbi:MAG: hypothetical protein AAGK23_09220 [Pseudomonadota bacterium]
MICQLKFGVMRLEHSGYQFDIGLSRAVLRLDLEGCETKLGTNFCERPLAHVEETNVATSSSAFEANAGASVVKGQGATGFLSGKGGVDKSNATQRSLIKTDFPVRALPNDAWEISAPTVKDNDVSTIQGTALSGQQLCQLQRTQGGNRMVVHGELHARKSDIEVSQKGGNKMGKMFSKRQNRDTLIGLVVGRAIEREATTSGAMPRPETVVVSKSEISER